MLSVIHDSQNPHLSGINTLILREVEEWPWCPLKQMRTLIEDQLSRPGKRMRPTLALAVVELLDGTFARAYPGAASVEFYHIASLILDDVQDNSEFRRGERTVHANVGMSTAINVAAIIRSFSYHPIHRCATLRDSEKAELHRRLDIAATHLLLGQSIDVGWNAGWYDSHRSFPYEQMARWKTGALYGAAASMAAIVSGASSEWADKIGEFGARFGILYQMADDFRDTFGPAEASFEPTSQDLAEGKVNYPIVTLGSMIDRESPELSWTIAKQLRKAETDTSTRRWLADQMATLGVHNVVKHEIRERAHGIVRDLTGWGLGVSRTRPLIDLVDWTAASIDAHQPAMDKPYASPE